MVSIRQSLSLLEEMALLEARADALMAKFAPRIAAMIPPPDGLPEPTMLSQADFGRDVVMVSGTYINETKEIGNIIRNLEAEGYSKEHVHEYRARNLSQLFVRYLMDADPDRTKSFSTWLLTMYLRGNLRLEDLPRYTEALAIYGEAVTRKKLPVEQRDINRFKTIEELDAAVSPFRQEYKEAQNAAYEAEMLRESQIIMDTSDYRILIPKTKEAAQWFGRSTEWCTAWGSKFGKYPTRFCRFDDYVKGSQAGPLYIITHKPTGEMWQFHFQTQQFMDVNDRRIDLSAFLRQHPEPANYFVEADRKTWTHLGKVGDWDAICRDQQQSDYRGSYNVRLFLLRTQWHVAQLHFPEQSAAFIASARNGNIASVVFGSTSEHMGAAEKRQLCAALTKSGIKGNHEDLIKFGIAYDTKRRAYVLTSEEQPIGSGRTNLVWRKTESHGANGPRVYYMLFKKDSDEALARVSVDPSDPNGWNFFKIEHPSKKIVPAGYNSVYGTPVKRTKHEWPAEIQEPMLNLLTQIANRKMLRPTGEDKIFHCLTKDRATKLAKLRPDWLNAADAFHLYGDTRAVRSRVLKELEDGGVDTYGWFGDRLIVAEYDTAEELIDTEGTEGAQWAASYSYGGESYEVYEAYLDYYNMRDILRKYQAHHRDEYKKLVAYMRENYSEEIEENDWDIENPDDLVRLQEEVNDQDLKSAFKNAVRSGEEAGVEHEIYKQLEHELQHNPYVFFDKAGKWTKDWTYDAKVIVAVPLKDVVRIIDEDGLYSASSDGWLEALGDDQTASYRIDVRKDSDFYGFDEEVAAESFYENIDFL